MRLSPIPMIAHPYCKINLGLHVLRKRPDGYHDIETIFVPVFDMRDTLIITESDTPEMIQDGFPLDNAPEDNICMKAWQLLHDEFGVPPVTIRLLKGIPFGAGLGGGSSDAAFTLNLLNQRYLKLSIHHLRHYAAKLGADCAFFVQKNVYNSIGRGLVYATGKGDQLKPLGRINLKGYRFVIEMPKGEHVSTKDAYAGLNHYLFGQSRIKLTKAIYQPIKEWRHLIVNDFEASVFPAHPAIAELKYDMYRRGAVYASMTGSGAAVFGIFPR